MSRQAASARRRVPGKTRMRIIEAARALMVEQDHLEISIAEITDRASANIAAVSYHFGGREGLMVSIARADADELIVELDKLLAAPMSAPDKLRAHIAGVVRAYHRRPYLHRLLHKLLREGSSETATLVGEFFVTPVYEARRTILEQGMAQGSFRRIDPWLVAHALEGACAQFFASTTSRALVLGIDRLDSGLVEAFGRSTAELIVRGVLTD